MSKAFNADLDQPLPTPSILIDPCVAIDEQGLWATARLQGATMAELDLFLPARRSIRRVEIGHGEEAVSQLGRGSRQRILKALDKALEKPLRLVLDPRRSDGAPSPLLDNTLTPVETAIHTLAALFEADSYAVAGHAIEFSIRKPHQDRLGQGAAKVFGPHAAALFRGATRFVTTTLGKAVKAVPKRSPSRILNPVHPLRVARYVRTATVNARGHNTMEAQHGRINGFLQELGIRSEHIAVDEGCNGMGSGRAGLSAIMRLAERGEIDAVVATSADRFFRSATQFDRLLAQLRSMGVSVMLVDHASTLGLGHGSTRGPRR